MINKFGEMLEHADRSMNHNIIGNDKCEGLKIMDYSAISSQAMSQGNDSGKVQRSGVELPTENGMLMGMLLGDASLTNRKDSRIRMDHSMKQIDYLKYKSEMLKSFGYENSIRERPRLVKGKEYQTAYLHTNTSDLLRKLRGIWYVDGKKVLPLYLNDLDLTGLAIWFMDDGGVESSLWNGKRYYRSLMFSTYSFSKEENERLIKLLKDKWDINAKLQKYRDKFIIRLLKKEAVKFAQLISPVLKDVPSMQYKLQVLGSNNTPTSAEPAREDMIQPAMRVVDVEHKQLYDNSVIPSIRQTAKLGVTTRPVLSVTPTA